VSGSSRDVSLADSICVPSKFELYGLSLLIPTITMGRQKVQLASSQIRTNRVEARDYV